MELQNQKSIRQTIQTFSPRTYITLTYISILKVSRPLSLQGRRIKLNNKKVETTVYPDSIRQHLRLYKYEIIFQNATPDTEITHDR